MAWARALKPAEPRVVESPGNSEEGSCQQLLYPLATDQPAKSRQLKLKRDCAAMHTGIHMFKNVERQ